MGIENAGGKYDSLEVYLANNEIGKHDHSAERCTPGPRFRWGIMMAPDPLL